MSEHLPTHEKHEQHEHHEHARSAEHHKPKHETAAELTQAEQAEKLEAIHKTIEKEAASSKEMAIHEEEAKQPKSQLGVNQELKQASYDRLIARVRRQLSVPDRMLSKVTHQPVVDTLSRAGEKTIARPSPLLFGGFTALVGSTILLYMAKHYGFSYNLGAFFGLFAIGFGIGILFDVFRFAARRGRPASKV